MNIDQIVNPKTPTSAQLQSAFMLTAAVAEAVREAGEIPSGTVYAAMLSRIDLAGFEALIRTLKGAGLISETAHMLRWIGPTFEVRK